MRYLTRLLFLQRCTEILSIEYLSFGRRQYRRDVWQEELLPKIKDIIIFGLQPAQDSVEHRKVSCAAVFVKRIALINRCQNSFELYGFDIMVDENLRPWLIEINSSPSMDKVPPLFVCCM